MENLKEKFEEAQANSKKLPNQSNDILLNLYSLYKQATEGDVSGAKPNMFDFKGATKYEAWASKKGLSKEEAMQQYVDLVNKLSN